MSLNLDFNNKKYLMGILNVTPDSFFDGGKYTHLDAALKRVEAMVADGADIIDIGGESTRPGAALVSAQEELDRVCPVVEEIKKNFDIIISVDTSKAIVAEESIKNGAAIINDISGFTFDENMPMVAAKYDAYSILMHTSGTPEEMQDKTEYKDLIVDIKEKLLASVNRAIDAGLKKSKIIIDPGIGFGKELRDNYRIINQIKDFKDMGFPLLIGLSRKSLISKLYKEKVDTLIGTVALNSISLYKGCDIIRVHDIKEHRYMLDVVELLLEGQ